MVPLGCNVVSSRFEPSPRALVCLWAVTVVDPPPPPPKLKLNSPAV